MTRPAIVLDIETRPDPVIAASQEWWQRFEATVEPPSNYKKEEAIAKFRAEALGKAQARMALSPLTGCIAMIGEADVDKDDEGHVWRCGEVNRTTESSTLIEFADMLTFNHPVTPPIVIGWNVRRFDVPFLLARCAVHGIQLPPWFPTLRTYRADLFDLLADAYGEGKMSEWGYLLGDGFKDVEGADLLTVPLDELEAHLVDDLKRTRTLARRCEWAWRR